MRPQFLPELDFDSLWNFAGEWFEPPNQHRQGWSGVSRIPLQMANTSSPVYAFLKRQHNFMRKTWLHPWRGVSTFYCEHQNLLRLSKHGIPVPTPLFFFEKNQGRDVNAVLLTAELVDHTPLDQVIHKVFSESGSRVKQRKLITSVARTVRQLHRARFQHRALYPKHIGYTDLMVDGAPSPHQSDTTLRWLIDRLRS